MSMKSGTTNRFGVDGSARRTANEPLHVGPSPRPKQFEVSFRLKLTSSALGVGGPSKMSYLNILHFQARETTQRRTNSTAETVNLGFSQTDGVSDADFEEAITEAKSEGNRTLLIARPRFARDIGARKIRQCIDEIGNVVFLPTVDRWWRRDA
jgi:hypothetical protein